MVLLWALTLLWAGLIVSFSRDCWSALRTGELLGGFGISAPWIQATNTVVRKTVHLSEYAVFGASLSLAVLTHFPRFYGRGGARVLAAVCALYALADEAHQVFQPHRTAAARDVVIDTVGAALAIYVLYRLRRFRKLIPTIN